MKVFSTKYVSCWKKCSILTLLHLTFLHSLTISAADVLSTPYTPHENIALDCGSTDNNTDLAGRFWSADDTIFFDQSNKKSLISTSPARGDSVPYNTARLSRSEFSYSFTVTPGPKFIRLYFYPASYLEFNRSNAFFDVHIDPFTLLRNFSPALIADDLKSKVFYREICVNVGDQKLNIRFTPNPEIPNSYAFINGIEIVSMPKNLYCSAKDDIGFDFVDQVYPYRVLQIQALETLYRVNVGGSSI